MNTKIYILTILTFVLFSKVTIACTCIGESTIKDEIKKKDAVFVGTISESEELRIYDTLSSNQIIHRIEMKYRMIIETVYKGGQVSDTVFIFTGNGGGDCGYNFKVGQKYIVYAAHIEVEGIHNTQMFIDKKSSFYTTICTRTRKFENQEIKEIEKHLKKKKRKRGK